MREMIYGFLGEREREEGLRAIPIIYIYLLLYFSNYGILGKNRLHFRV